MATTRKFNVWTAVIPVAIIFAVIGGWLFWRRFSSQLSKANKTAGDVLSGVSSIADLVTNLVTFQWAQDLWNGLQSPSHVVEIAKGVGSTDYAAIVPEANVRLITTAQATPKGWILGVVVGSRTFALLNAGNWLNGWEPLIQADLSGSVTTLVSEINLAAGFSPLTAHFTPTRVDVRHGVSYILEGKVSLS